MRLDGLRMLVMDEAVAVTQSVIVAEPAVVTRPATVSKPLSLCIVAMHHQIRLSKR
jgi:hypothetical protein